LEEIEEEEEEEEAEDGSSILSVHRNKTLTMVYSIILHVKNVSSQSYPKGSGLLPDACCHYS
jgi:hypothetical protein